MLLRGSLNARCPERACLVNLSAGVTCFQRSKVNGCDSAEIAIVNGFGLDGWHAAYEYYLMFVCMSIDRLSCLVDAFVGFVGLVSLCHGMAMCIRLPDHSLFVPKPVLKKKKTPPSGDILQGFRNSRSTSYDAGMQLFVLW